MTRKPQPLHLTFALMLFAWTGVSSARVVLTLDALNLGAQPGAVGLLVATFYVFPLLLSWPVGALADRIGSRSLLFAGSVVGTGAMAIPFFLRELPALYAAGFLVGLSFSVYNLLLQNLVGLMSPPQVRARNFSNASLVGATTNFVGPLMAGLSIDYSGHAYANLYTAMLPLMTGVLLAAWGGVLPGGRKRKLPPRRILDALAEPGIGRILGLSSLVQLAQDLFQFYMPVYGHEQNLSATAIGAVLAAYAAASFVARFAMPRLIVRLGEERLLEYSFYLTGVAFLLIPFFKTAFTLVAVAFVFGLGMGCGQPVTTMLTFSQSAEGRSGETLGLRQTVNNMVRVAGPAAFGFVASAFGLFAVFWINGLMMGGGGRLGRPRPGRNPE